MISVFWHVLFLTVLLKWLPFDCFWKIVQFLLNPGTRTQQFIYILDFLTPLGPLAVRQ